MFKAVRVLSIFDLKGGTSSSASRDIRTLLVILIDHGDRFMGLFFCWQKKTQEGTKTHGIQLHSRDIAVTRFGDWNALVQYLTQHGCSMDSARYRLDWQVRGAEPSWFRTNSLCQSELRQHGTARLGTMLACFGHVYTATANRAEPYWYLAGTVSSDSVNAALVFLKMLTSFLKTSVYRMFSKQEPIECPSALWNLYHCPLTCYFR